MTEQTKSHADWLRDNPNGFLCVWSGLEHKTTTSFRRIRREVEGQENLQVLKTGYIRYRKDNESRIVAAITEPAACWFLKDRTCFRWVVTERTLEIYDALRKELIANGQPVEVVIVD